jgi:hypothetical protein
MSQHHVQGTTIPYALHAVSFGFGEMMARQLHRRDPPAIPISEWCSPSRRRGGPAMWLPFLDEKWERAGDRLPVPSEEPPSHWFARLLDPANRWPGYRYCVEAGLEDRLLVATDFRTPRTSTSRRVAALFRGDDSGITDAQLRSSCRRTPPVLYGLSSV